MVPRDTQGSKSEAAQVQLSLGGDAQAFSQLVRPYRLMFYKKALSIVRNEADAEDVTQSALLKAFKKLSQFRCDSRFRTWVTSIVINEARMCLRAHRQAKHESLESDEQKRGPSSPDVTDRRENPSQVLERKQLRAAILGGVSALPLLYRSVFVLRDIRRLSTSDTAKILGISESSVKSRLRRARLQLRRSLVHFFRRADARSGLRMTKQHRHIEFRPGISWSPKVASEIEAETIH
jgi:RNA polymerase sigma-70 factor, ECF subfamily